MVVDRSKRVIDLTVGELLDLLEGVDRPQAVVDTTRERGRYVYGLSGIAGLFGCSRTTANRLKQSGRIDRAITQIGNIIVVDAEKALELAGKKNNKK